MKKLVLVRHGSYGGDDHLSSDGRRQIEALAKKLKTFVNGASIVILTSIADRARESAEILSSFFGVEHEQHEILWSENSHPEDFNGTLELIRSNSNKGDILILVTHYEYVEYFPSYFAEKELGAALHPRLIGKGEAWVVDCAEKTLTHIC